MSSFVPSFTAVTAPGADPSRYLLVLHGILGSGANFRSFARRLAAACPAWALLLVDLRLHGQSQGAPPPHTVASAAEDLVRLAALPSTPAVAGVLGHSFGGKVALAYAERAGRVLDQVWVLDASPGTRRSHADHDETPGGDPRAAANDRTSATEEVLRTLRALPDPLPSRERFFEIVAERGHSRAIADWLAMNLRRADDGFRLRLDLDAVGALLESYHATDLWPVLEDARAARAFHVVVADRSDVIDADDRARLAALAAREPRVHVHTVAGAGHWVHVDAPDAIFSLVSAALGAGG
jgi:esterase